MELNAWKRQRDALLVCLQAALKWGHRECAGEVAMDIAKLMNVPTVPEQESKTIAAACCHYKNMRSKN